MDGDEIRQWQQLVREVLVAPPVQDYAIRLVLATHPRGEFAAAETNKFIRCGASPRGAQAMVLAAKVRALLEGRYNVSFEDMRRVYLPALRHRILLNFEAQAENIPSDEVLDADPERGEGESDRNKPLRGCAERSQWTMRDAGNCTRNHRRAKHTARCSTRSSWPGSNSSSWCRARSSSAA